MKGMKLLKHIQCNQQHCVLPNNCSLLAQKLEVGKAEMLSFILTAPAQENEQRSLFLLSM